MMQQQRLLVLIFVGAVGLWAVTGVSAAAQPTADATITSNGVADSHLADQPNVGVLNAETTLAQEDTPTPEETPTPEGTDTPESTPTPGETPVNPGDGSSTPGGVVESLGKILTLVVDAGEVIGAILLVGGAIAWGVGAGSQYSRIGRKLALGGFVILLVVFGLPSIISLLEWIAPGWAVPSWMFDLL